MSKKHNSSLYNERRTEDEIETLASDDSRKIDTRAKKKLLGPLRNKTFRW